MTAPEAWQDKYERLLWAYGNAQDVPTKVEARRALDAHVATAWEVEREPLEAATRRAIELLKEEEHDPEPDICEAVSAGKYFGCSPCHASAVLQNALSDAAAPGGPNTRSISESGNGATTGITTVSSASDVRNGGEIISAGGEREGTP